MKNLTHILAIVAGGAATLATSQWGSALLATHPKATGIVGGLLGLAALYFNPREDAAK